MTESRDRLSRAVDVAAIYARRRRSVLSGIFEDDLETSPFGSSLHGATTDARTGTLGVGGFGTPQGPIAHGRNLQRTQAAGIENTPIRTVRQVNASGRGGFGSHRGQIGTFRRVNGSGRGRAWNSVLPTWYPRTPLRDVTEIVRAIERRRQILGGGEGQEIGTPLPQSLRVLHSSESPSVAHLEHSNTFMSPITAPGVKKCPPTVGKVPKILLDVTNKESGDSELTPQKKLLNSIDTVEKQVMEELRKLKRTPIAKKAEREKRVRTLMSMR